MEKTILFEIARGVQLTAVLLLLRIFGGRASTNVSLLTERNMRIKLCLLGF